MDYQIITDSAWDMGALKAEALSVDVIPFFIAKDGEHYQKEVVELSVRELYQYMVDHPGIYPKTSQPSPDEYISRFEACAKAGKDVIFCCVNQVFSGAFNTAMLAKNTVEEAYPGIRITVIDTMQATLMQGLIVQELCYCQQAGTDYETAVKIAEGLSRNARIYFALSGMDYLIHGGRVGKLAGMAANVLNLCPMICLAEGELLSKGIARGRKQARKRVLQMLIDHIKKNGNDPSRYALIVGHGYDISEGDIMKQMLLERLQEEWPEYHAEFDSAQIGAAIGVHTGPYPIGYGIVDRWSYFMK